MADLSLRADWNRLWSAAAARDDISHNNPCGNHDRKGKVESYTGSSAGFFSSNLFHICAQSKTDEYASVKLAKTATSIETQISLM